MAEKKAFPFRMNPDVYAAIEKWAADEFRSVNGQLEWIIARALREAGRLHTSATEISNPPHATETQE